MTSDPFKAAADLALKIQGLKPITTRPAWERAQLLSLQLSRQALSLPDDFTVSEPNIVPAAKRAGAGVTSTGSVTGRAGLKISPPTEPTSAIQKGEHDER